jgi:ribonuclease E
MVDLWSFAAAQFSSGLTPASSRAPSATALRPSAFAAAAHGSQGRRSFTSGADAADGSAPISRVPSRASSRGGGRSDLGPFAATAAPPPMPAAEARPSTPSGAPGVLSATGSPRSARPAAPMGLPLLVTSSRSPRGGSPRAAGAPSAQPAPSPGQPSHRSLLPTPEPSPFVGGRAANMFGGRAGAEGPSGLGAEPSVDVPRRRQEDAGDGRGEEGEASSPLPGGRSAAAGAGGDPSSAAAGDAASDAASEAGNAERGAFDEDGADGDGEPETETSAAEEEEAEEEEEEAEEEDEDGEDMEGEGGGWRRRRRRTGGSTRESLAGLVLQVASLPGAPVRAVQQRLSNQLRRVFERRLAEGRMSPEAAEDLRRGSQHLQALGLGAVVAETQEGKPGEQRALL